MASDYYIGSRELHKDDSAHVDVTLPSGQIISVTIYESTRGEAGAVVEIDTARASDAVTDDLVHVYVNDGSVFYAHTETGEAVVEGVDA